MKTLLPASQATERSRLYSLLLVIAGVFLIFFEVPLAFNVREIIDDTCYLSWLHRFLFIPDTACPQAYHLPGTALLWIPAGIAGRIGAFLLHSGPSHWISTFIGLTSYACWAASLILVDRFVSRSPSSRLRNFSWVALFLLSVPVLHYATARATMAHAAEIFLALTTLYLATKRHYTASLIFGFWLCATRVNDAPIILVIFARMWDERASSIGGITTRQKRLAAGAILVTLLASIPIIRLAFFHYYGGASTTGLIPILKNISWREFFHVMGGDYWGLIFTGPFWLLGLGAGIVFFQRLSWMARASWFWMALLLLVAIGWGGMGNSFGYRYLIGTYAGLLILWIELIPLLSSAWDKAFKVALIAQAAWLTHLTWTYDHFSNYWEILTHWQGLRSLKDLAYPITRFGYSPTGIFVKSFLYPVSRVEKYTGPFHAHLGRTALWVNALLTVLSLAAVGYALIQHHRQKAFRAPSLQDRSSASRLSFGLFLLSGKERKS